MGYVIRQAFFYARGFHGCDVNFLPWCGIPLWAWDLSLGHVAVQHYKFFDLLTDEEESAEDDADVVTRVALKRQSQQIIESKTKRRTRYRKKDGK